MAVSWELLVRLTPDLDTVYLGVCPTTRCHHFCGNDVTGCIQVCKMHQGWFSGLGNAHNKERYNLECSWMSSVLHNCNPVVFSLLWEGTDPLLFIENKSSLRGKSPLHSRLPP